jgi:transcriptional regulator with XRE-family HTH domain
MEECSVFRALMASFRPDTHKTLATLLRKTRREKRLSLARVASRLPTWMHFDHSKLGRVERGERDVSYAELREIAKAIETTIGDLVNAVEDIIAAKRRVSRPRIKKRQ